MVRYFAAVSRPPAYGLAVLAAVTALGVATLLLNPRELDSSLGMLLLVQMLLTSSGFAPASRRGHFDPMLVHGRDRIGALIAQWLASVLAGAIAWLAIGTAGLWLGSPAAVSALAGRRVIAFWIVSALSWSLGFALPRGAGGGLWLVLLIVLLVWHADLLSAASEDSAAAVLRAAAAVVLCPFLLLGHHVRIGVPALGAAAAAAGVVLLSTWRAGAGLDIFLVERS